ncbi:MAG: hypothetical protein IT446_00060 [Phycisphaerales bacterium]|nr:hypothetical protein [Phycisphaerales bacterium]
MTSTEPHPKLTRRENLRKVLSGRDPAWVPFAINFEQWFKHHKTFATLPDELRGCETYIDAQKALGCDIFSRNLDGGFREVDQRIKPKITQVNTDIGLRTITEYHTPRGTLRNVFQEQAAITTGHTEEYMVKDWETDGGAFECFLDQHEYRWDVDAFIKVNDQVGDWGIVNVPFGCTPLKFLHLHFGLEYSCLFANDYPDAAKRICDLYWKKLRPWLIALAEHPRVESVCLMDNVDTPFYPPSMAGELWEPYVKDAADLLRDAGKHLFVHACGKLSALNPTFARCHVSGLEGISHPYLGDWSADAARNCHPDFIFIGGFSAREQQSLDDDQVRAFYGQYLPKTDKRRFIFAASCQTSIHTPWNRIKLVKDICRQWGGHPHSSQGRVS